MQLIEKFHKMEIDNKLFELGKNINLPIWDILRYHIYVRYYYPEKDRQRLSEVIKHNKIDYFYLIIHLILLPFKMLLCRGENVVISSSRFNNIKGEFFDKCSIAIIKSLDKNCLVIEPILGKRMAYNYIYDFNNVFRRFFKSKSLSLEYYNKINDALIFHLNENRISYEDLNTILHNFYSDYFFYKLFFSLMKTKKVFIATGNPKAELLAANKLNTSSYLIQHASIEFDEIDYSYPLEISMSSNILFPHYILTMGDYWCKNVNIPTRQIIPIGNDFFYSKPKVESDNSILIVSTIVHGGELSILTKQLATQRNDLKFVYKLHPNEFQYYNEYVDFFKDNKNVCIIANQTDTNILIAKSQLVIIIVSAVLYEALNQNKKVAVYKKINYQRQLSLSKLSNIYFFDTIVEISEILEKETVISDVNFYKPTDYQSIRELLYK